MHELFTGLRFGEFCSCNSNSAWPLLTSTSSTYLHLMGTPYRYRAAGEDNYSEWRAACPLPSCPMTLAVPTKSQMNGQRQPANQIEGGRERARYLGACKAILSRCTSAHGENGANDGDNPRIIGFIDQTGLTDRPGGQPRKFIVLRDHYFLFYSRRSAEPDISCIPKR